MAYLDQTINNEQDQHAARALVFVFGLWRSPPWRKFKSAPFVSLVDSYLGSKFPSSTDRLPWRLPEVCFLLSQTWPLDVLLLVSASCISRIWPGQRALGCHCFCRKRGSRKGKGLGRKKCGR